MSQTPSVGRIVHYVSYGTPGGEFLPEHRAAIITAVPSFPGKDESMEEISVCVINPSGLFFHAVCPHDEAGKKGGSWHYPEFVPGVLSAGSNTMFMEPKDK